MVGGGTFVDDYNGVLQFPMHEMQPEVGAFGQTPWTDLNQAVNGRGHLREFHPVLLWHKEIQWMW